LLAALSIIAYIAIERKINGESNNACDRAGTKHQDKQEF
jgi:hypothetical protein